MKNRVKTTALLLVLLLILPILASCGKNDSASGDTSDDENEFEFNISKDLSYEGQTFTVLTFKEEYSDTISEIIADENDESRVSKAITERNETIKEWFGVEIEEIPAVGNEAFTKAARESILAGSGKYDLLIGTDYETVSNRGLYHELYTNVYDLPYIGENIDKPWFYSDFAEEISINDKLYLLGGDLNLSSLNHTLGVYFNKSLAEENKLGDLYELVRNGEWTIDRTIEMTKSVTDNIDSGDTEFYGYLLDIFVSSAETLINTQFDLNYFETDENGLPSIVADRDKIVSVFEKAVPFIIGNTYFEETADYIESPCPNMLKDGKALFFVSTLEYADDMSRSGFEFGILPPPKWDENQSDYYSHAEHGYTICAVPLDIKDSNMVGTVLCALYQYSHEKLLPAFIDDATTNASGKADTDSAEMLGIIRNGTRFGFDQLYRHEMRITTIPSLLIANKIKDDIGMHFDSYYEAFAINAERFVNNFTKPY